MAQNYQKQAENNKNRSNLLNFGGIYPPFPGIYALDRGRNKISFKQLWLNQSDPSNSSNFQFSGCQTEKMGHSEIVCHPWLTQQNCQVSVKSTLFLFERNLTWTFYQWTWWMFQQDRGNQYDVLMGIKCIHCSISTQKRWDHSVDA